MQETLKEQKKNKINLSDYDFRSDVRYRVFLSTISIEEFEVLEEILYSPLEYTVEEDQIPILNRLLPLGLFTLNKKVIRVDKERRKYFETQIARFEEDFRPGAELIQNLLKNVPIQVLPLWYQIPRSSNNIYESLIEKYLATPQIYQRYLAEFRGGEEMMVEVVNEIFDAEDLCVTAKEIQKKFRLSPDEFEEMALFLEYSLVAFTSFRRADDGFEEIITPLHEWKEYLLHIQRNQPKKIEKEKEISVLRDREYSFIEDMSSILELTEENEIGVRFDSMDDQWKLTKSGFSKITGGLKENYANRLINKLLVLGLAVIEETALKQTRAAPEWLRMPIEKRAHVTFKHPHNFLAIEKASPISTQRAVLEIERSISTVAHLGWVYFDDFLAASTIALRDEDKVSLKRTGKTWRYAIPQYDAEQKSFIQFTILEWLFESGIVQVGTHKSKPCFKVTSLGRALFH